MTLKNVFNYCTSYKAGGAYIVSLKGCKFNAFNVSFFINTLFLDKPQPRFQEKYDFSFDKNSTRASEASSAYSDTLNKSRKRSFNADYSTLSRDEKAEIIYAKTKVSKLEEQMKTLETEKKVAQIEQDKRRRSETLKNLKNQEECESLRKT